MNRTIKYLDDRVRIIKEADRIRELEKKVDLLMDLIESQQKSISFILDVLKPKEEEPEEEAIKLFDENFEHPINMLDELFSSPKPDPLMGGFKTTGIEAVKEIK